MSAKSREGRMRKRSERSRFAPELGYYIIVTDATKTEKHYFEGLRNSLPPDLARKLTIKVHAGVVPEELVSFCLKQVATNPQYAEPWIVIDRDEVARFDDLVAEAQAHDIKVAWSNQCFEAWMSMYFGSIIHEENAQRCTNRFGVIFEKATGSPYRKNDERLYEKLSAYGDEESALRRSEKQLESLSQDCKQPSAMVPCSTVHELVGEIRSKATLRQGAQRN